MRQNLTIHLEASTGGKGLLPWVALTRHGRQSVGTQCFALLGYPERELAPLTSTQLEEAREAAELAIRLMSTFEYIPSEAQEIESFFEKKLVSLETKLRSAATTAPALQGAVGIIHGNSVLFTSSGEILILHITPDSVVNLASTTRGGPLHFDTFNSGALTERNTLLIIPKSLGTLLKSEELKQLHAPRSSQQRLEYLRQIWEKRTAKTGNFRAILLTAKPQVIRESETTAVSIAHLLNTEAKTEELLSPPLLRPIFTRLGSAGEKGYRSVLTALQRVRTKLKSTAAAPPTAPRTAPTLSAYLMRVSQSGKTILNSTTTKLQRPFQLTRDAGRNFRSAYPAALWHTITARVTARFNALPYKSKVILIVAITLLFLFAQGVLWTKQGRTITQAQELLQGEVLAIETMVNNASAALIYNDEEKARELLAATINRTDNLLAFQRVTASQLGLRSLRTVKGAITPKTVTKLKDSLVPIQEKLRHVITIDNPAPVDGKLSATLNLKDSPHNIATYNKKTYTLQPEANQVLKDGTPWIKDGTDVKNGVGLAVDGSAYVLEGNGRVIELRKGVRRANFGLSPVDPPLTKGTKIWTDERSDYLYVLDPQEKRLLAFAKNDGLLKAQYQSPTFTELRDFRIDEGKKLAYLLDGTSIVSIPLAHFTK